MADRRTLVTVVSIATALIASSWAIYESKHDATAVGARPQQGAPRPPGGAGNVAARPGGPRTSGNPIAVITALAESKVITVGVSAIGTANANEAVNVTTKVSNLVTAIHFSDGQVVRKGQVLVELDRAQASADLAAAVATLEESRSQFNRSRELLATQALSRAQHEQLEATLKANEARAAAARARLADCYVRAPFSGRVGMRRVSLGALISPGTIITTLDDISAIKLDFTVPEAQLSDLRAGQTVVARTTTYPGRNFAGRVTTVDSRVDSASRAVTVRAVIPNADGALKPGMFLTVELAKEQRKALVIPEAALVPEQARQFVYVVIGAAVAKREVELGRREPGTVEITSGLVAGDRVVVEGTLKLRDGVAVREADNAPS
jgi:membrane fusion protein, multidrug efflux system